VPADTLARFSTLVWVGDNFRGDLEAWFASPVISFLEAGGNVLLLARYGQSYVFDALRDYLGVTWREAEVSRIERAVAEWPGLVDMDPTGFQNFNAVFDLTLERGDARLLFSDRQAFAEPRGVGVWRKPQDGGWARSAGGSFAFVSGRPYRWNREALRKNTERILTVLFQEPWLSPEWPMAPAVPVLAQNVPNPFNPSTLVRFSLPAAGRTRVDLFDAQGRLVRTLVDGELGAGRHAAIWDGMDRGGRPVAAGVYFARLTGPGGEAGRKLVLLR